MNMVSLKLMRWIFAGLAMCGMRFNPDHSGLAVDEIATQAVQQADALLEVLAPPKPKRRKRRKQRKK